MLRLVPSTHGHFHFVTEPGGDCFTLASVLKDCLLQCPVYEYILSSLTLHLLDTALFPALQGDPAISLFSWGTLNLTLDVKNEMKNSDEK